VFQIAGCILRPHRLWHRLRNPLEPPQGRRSRRRPPGVRPPVGRVRAPGSGRHLRGGWRGGSGTCPPTSLRHPATG
jgi:hypothetical protein